MPIFYIGKINANVTCGHDESTFMARKKKQLGIIFVFMMIALAVSQKESNSIFGRKEM